MYIRTKDGVYEVKREEVDKTYYGEVFDNFYLIGDEQNEDSWVSETEVIKEADTIEELCDGVIEKCLSGNRFCPIEMFNKQEAIKCMNIDFNKGYKKFYYGIFVEHNGKIDFISVAKMNEKGELVLI